ncbi:uncharacterized protein LOC106642064 [Copidosoma floridanum]|uniref:uncharacterized protein LOC106642064 n=1 Tax=Copidosoma floridanum TaxID=29053 RepID=UPI0006C99924|nr:uncharacterized protein LOC106642064 [Copidosoma floridanum]
MFMIVPLLPKLLDYIFPLNESRPMRNLLEVQYYVDVDKYYVHIYFHGVQAAVLVILIILAIDSYFVMIIQHACGMFIVLGHRLGEVSHANSKTLNLYSNRERDIIMSTKIIKCVKYHCKCMRFFDMIESSFSVSFVMFIFLNMAIISVTAVQTTRTTDPLEVLSFGLNTVSVMFRLFFLSWSGQRLFDHSARIDKFLSNVTWYEFPQKPKKLIYIMLIRSLRPSYITIGKIAPLNFETYGSLIKTSMSFFTMIMSTQ